MAEDSSTRRKPAGHVNELKNLVGGYARQETVDPLKTLGRYLGFGVGGAISIGLGVILCLMAMLRALESLGDMNGDRGAWSLVPYAATMVSAIVVIVVAVLRITKEPKKGPKS